MKVIVTKYFMSCGLEAKTVGYVFLLQR